MPQLVTKKQKQQVQTAPQKALRPGDEVKVLTFGQKKDSCWKRSVTRNGLCKSVS
ncbi:hypothetical protein GCM10020331_033510 [Ectobacillus funiculus]